MNIAWVRCPLEAAMKAAEKRRILVGWSSAKIQLMQAKPVRCYRCLQEGDVGAKCPTGATDIKCFGCSGTGHAAANCERDPHCELCAKKGLKADHKVGKDSARRDEPTLHVMVRFLQGNVNRSREAQDLMVETAKRMGTSLIIMCEPHRKTRRDDANQFTEEEGDVTMVQNTGTVDRPFRKTAAGKGYVIVSDGIWQVAGCYYSPNRPLREFEEYLASLSTAVRHTNVWSWRETSMPDGRYSGIRRQQ
ncbi:UNVERIFIED_CONTAM: hypothetical protein PYX00_005044 [Menopon gallinae]|uniref:CCHC-type domain-containing protein n=1 Tax=Menopon gallinae TaxID=328185 RepID=A0AAW2I808_9NEOP